ncbi:MAG: carbamoyltransferase [Candidatus Omnitrophica bacterium]|nr:carbamoyltransferase [Candidatus Omnitrophota bacterium]
MNILGISCWYHDAAACLLCDGVIVAAAQEERFNRKKHSPVFPIQAINYCLQHGNVSIDDIDYIGLYEKPFLKFSRVIVNHLKSYPYSLNNFLDTVPSWLEDRLITPLVLKRKLGYTGTVLFIRHHLSHAASAFLVSPFEKAAILTADAVGEQASITTGCGNKNGITITKEIRYPHSLGLLYTTVTTYLGFRAHSGEGKVMGLAGYGNHTYADKFNKIITIRADGSFNLNERFFGFNKGRRMYSKEFIELFGKERNPEDPIEERHCNIAAGLQQLIEQIVITIARNLYRETQTDCLCLAGGVFLNCVANNAILEETPFNRIFIQPAAGDSGGALGVAAYIYHSLLGNPRTHSMQHAYLGPEFSHISIKRTLINHHLDFKEMDESELYTYVARLIAANRIGGWFQGRMEFGPRALGNRSIIANPCNPMMKELLNKKVKKRESFRPYAPAVLEENAKDYFRMNVSSPFMLLASHIRKDKEQTIPAVTHIDKTARVQTVSMQTNPKFWKLIKEFEKISGVPIVLNTSFNLKDEPIVCTPRDAIDCFNRSQMDYLVVGKFVIEKNL